MTARTDILAAAVTARISKGGEQRVVAYVEYTGEAPAEDELRAYLGERLPRQMTPDRFVFCETLPLTAANKVDRRRLPEPPRVRPKLSTPFKAPQTPIEIATAVMFGDALELDEVGLQDSFFELGGKSLGAMRVLVQLVNRYGVRIEATEFFERPTVGALASTVSTRLMLGADPGSLADLLDQIEGLADIDVRRLLED